MAISKLTKERVKNVVLAYKGLYPDEYELGVRANKARAVTQEKWGEFSHDKEFGREVTRMPQTLQTALQVKLSAEQYDQLYSREGLTWFLRSFPEWSPNQEKE